MDGPKKKSKKPSVTSSSKPLDAVVFFVDRSLGRKTVAETLRAAGARAEVHDDHLPQDAKDETWLKFVGQRNWVVLTHDDRIRYRYAEQSALLEAKVRTFVLAAKGLRAEDNAVILVKALPKILRTLRHHAGPFIARIGRGSEVTLLFGQRRKQRP
jgi:predicted nuclease of predicted toxin-antitoxin system